MGLQFDGWTKAVFREKGVILSFSLQTASVKSVVISLKTSKSQSSRFFHKQQQNSITLVDSSAHVWIWRSSSADVNRALRGGGVSEDRARTHTTPSGFGSRFNCSLPSWAVKLLSGRLSLSSSNSSGCSLLHASETQLPLVKNFPTITKL